MIPPRSPSLVISGLLQRACWPVCLGLVWLAGCTTVDTGRSPPPPAPAAAPVPVQPPAATPADKPAAGASQARTARDYRQDAARHVYAREVARIYKGRLPPMLHAVGVLNVDIDRRGQVQSLQWQRAPRHAPEVMAEIEKIVRAAAPFPVPERLGKVTYTDVWLWHRSGRFQLDTLTEGQD